MHEPPPDYPDADPGRLTPDYTPLPPRSGAHPPPSTDESVADEDAAQAASGSSALRYLLKLFKELLAIVLPKRDPDLDAAAIASSVFSGDPRGEEVVGIQHEHRFVDCTDGLETALASACAVITTAITHTEADVAAKKRQRDKLPSHDIVIDREGPQWTGWSFTTAILFGLATLGLIFIGWNSVAIILRESGVETFEGLMAWVFSAVPFGTPFALKAIAPLRHDTVRRRFLLFTGLLGCCLGLAWGWLLVHTFPALGESSDVIVLPTDGKGPPASLGNLMLFVGLCADVFLSATAWLALDDLIARHQSRREKANISHARLSKEIQETERAIGDACALKGKLAARLACIAAKREAFVRRARNAFIRLRARERFHCWIEQRLNSQSVTGVADRTSQNGKEDNFTQDHEDQNR